MKCFCGLDALYRLSHIPINNGLCDQHKIEYLIEKRKSIDELKKLDLDTLPDADHFGFKDHAIKMRSLTEAEIDAYVELI